MSFRAYRPLIQILIIFLYSNATRVTVTGNIYAISLVYNPGYIIYRLRPIHYDSVGNRIEGQWSSSIGSPIYLVTYFSHYGYHWHGHENTLNWQYNAGYAEEGKRKEVTSYFDGTLRNRQSVTINNSENKAIIGETMYDFSGRPGVTTVPAPIDSGKIVYYDKFNVDRLDSEYNRQDFAAGACGTPPTYMDSLRGSSNYFSASNPDRTNGFNAYIPDAQGFPFTQTEYTPDKTGRISGQSVAGKYHYLGSGHETQYFYGKPFQGELDMLFGNEVGNFSHYMENMVIDANGQISISFIDESGKTIATALAGNPPKNLDSIPSYRRDSAITTSLLDQNENRSGSSITTTFGLMATNSGWYRFAYKLFPGNYTDNTCSKVSLCFDCLYDIQLKITDVCGGTPINLTHYDSNFSYKNAFDTTCSKDSNVIDTFSVYLTPGEYNITRLISVDPGAITFYTNDYLKHDSCLTSFSTFLDSALARMDFNGCNLTCQTCITSIGSNGTFVTNYINQLIKASLTPTAHDTAEADSLYSQEVANCNKLCQTPCLCTGIYNEMLADVSLGGQYCLYDTVPIGNDIPGDATSVLNGNYQHPNPPYKDASGNPSLVLINSYNYAPQDLTVTQFVHNWLPSWAQSLVIYHPEYCYYKYCIVDSASNDYTARMENTGTYAQALAAGFINPLGMASQPYYYSSATLDPYYQSGGQGASLNSTAVSLMTNYTTIYSTTLSMWQAAELITMCNIDSLKYGSSVGCFPPRSGFRVRW